MDIFIPVQPGQWFSYVQIDNLDNSNDGDDEPERETRREHRGQVLV